MMEICRIAFEAAHFCKKAKKEENAEKFRKFMKKCSKFELVFIDSEVLNSPNVKRLLNKEFY